MIQINIGKNIIINTVILISTLCLGLTGIKTKALKWQILKIRLQIQDASYQPVTFNFIHKYI